MKKSNILSINRRQFINKSLLGGLASTLSLPQLRTTTLLNGNESIPNWEEIRAQFPITNWDKIYFNSGSAGVMPTPVLNHLLQLVKQMNEIPPYEAWRIWSVTREKNLERLSGMLNVDISEVEVVRNTTEALNMIITGLPLEPGDQVLYSQYDYPFAKNSWKNRAHRDGIELIEVIYDLPANQKDILAAYQKVMTPQVKVVHCTHITHAQGHVMPVKELAVLAHQNNAQIVVDGAHSVGQLKVDLAEIDCDYFATSLHKWMNAPHGTGLLFAKKKLVNKLFNHPSSYLETSSSIRKFEHRGTRAFHQEIGISAALDFHEIMGSKAKYERLQMLKTYWTSQLEDVENVKFYTDLDRENSVAIVAVGIDNKRVGEYLEELKEVYHIHAKAVGGNWGSGIRVSVNIFTSFEELDHLVQAIRTIAAT